MTMVKPLKVQLADVGYAPADLTYLALLHYHYDHTANANEFAGATWLVRQDDRRDVRGEALPGVTQPSTYAALRNSKTLILKMMSMYSAMGLSSSRRHLGTPGHQVLYVKLAKTGGVWRSPAISIIIRRSAGWIAYRRSNYEEQTRATRVALDVFLKETGAQLWIQHDFTANAN